MVRSVDSPTMDGVIDGEPAWDDRGSLSAQQRVDVNVNLPYGIVSTVSVMVQHSDLQRLILQVLIINLERGREWEKETSKTVKEETGAEKWLHSTNSLLLWDLKDDQNI